MVASVSRRVAILVLMQSTITPPLKGIRVVELTHTILGPSCGMILGDLGAEVIKVEPPDGDITRTTTPRVNSMSSYFTQANTGKQCISIDLDTDDGRAVATARARGPHRRPHRPARGRRPRGRRVTGGAGDGHRRGRGLSGPRRHRLGGGRSGLGVAAKARLHVLALDGVENGWQSYTLVSFSHALDLLNLCVLLSPFAPILGIIALLRRNPLSRTERLLLVAAAGGLVFVLLVTPNLGMSRDWDLLAGFCLPAVVRAGTVLGNDLLDAILGKRHDTNAD